MDEKIYIEEIIIPSCIKCGKAGNFRGIKDGKIIYFCKNHLPKVFFTKTSSEPIIRLQNRGLFKTSSIVRTASSFSNIHWKDFGLARKTLRKENKDRREIRKINAGAESVFLDTFFHFGKKVGIITYHGEKLNYWECPLLTEDFLVCSVLDTPLFWIDKTYKYLRHIG